MFSEHQITELVDMLYELDHETKLYFGCDSVRFRKNGRWFAKYATVIVVHMNGRNGCRVFRDVSIEPDYDLKKDRPRMRLMNEVMKVCEAYNQVAPFVDEFPCEIHCDVNPDPQHGSNCVAKEAAGYVLAMTGLEPTLKPNAFAASFASDHYAHRDPKPEEAA